MGGAAALPPSSSQQSRSFRSSQQGVCTRLQQAVIVGCVPWVQRLAGPGTCAEVNAHGSGALLPLYVSILYVSMYLYSIVSMYLYSIYCVRQHVCLDMRLAPANPPALHSRGARALVPPLGPLLRALPLLSNPKPGHCKAASIAWWYVVFCGAGAYCAVAFVYPAIKCRAH